MPRPPQSSGQPIPQRVSGFQSGASAQGSYGQDSYETLAGREYDDAGRLRREWLATRHVHAPDQLLPRGPSGPSWFSRIRARVLRWIGDTVQAATLLGLMCGATWAASVFWGLGGALIAFGLACMVIGWSMGK